MSKELRDFVEIESPEAVDVELELAGLGSRFIAMFVDTLIQAFAAVVVIVGALILGVGLSSVQLEVFGVNLAVILVALGWFLLYWGYFVLFEVAKNGQTPGKAAVDIRVVREGGEPVTFFASAVRNLLRPLEYMVLAPFSVALVVFGRRHKRIGDWAAGTIVIKERAQSVPASEAALPESSGAAGAVPLTRIELAGLNEEELRLAMNFLARRGELEPEARLRLGAQIAERLAGKTGRDLTDQSAATCEAFVEEIVRAVVQPRAGEPGSQPSGPAQDTQA